MDAFNRVEGRLAPILAANIDTDVIMPKQFLKGIDRNGLDQGVFFDQRFLVSGEPNPDFVLNMPDWQGSKFLAVGPNFGCGSSREHAVWGLKQLGIRAIIGTTFAGIFYDNCQRNGLLLIELEPEQMKRIVRVANNTQMADITIDLAPQEILLSNGEALSFEIDPIRKDSLIKGLDAIGATLQRIQQIEVFEKQHLRDNPWLA